MLLRDVTIPNGRQVDIRLAEGVIDAVGRQLRGGPVVDASGLRVTPGAIDVHVHCREPGGAHKETWETGSRAAAAGGVTTIVDQPNTDPPTSTVKAFREKTDIAAASSIVDYGINAGVTKGWDGATLLDEPIAALGEVFMADSTGDLGVGMDMFEEALELAADADVLVTVHAEDETRFDDGVRDRSDANAWSEYRRPAAEVAAVARACEVAERYGTRIHIAHASTPGAIDLAHKWGQTAEVSPHHLLLSTEHLDRLGTFGRMNPPLRDESIRSAVADRVHHGSVAMIATDHAPHTIEEKETDIWSAPSGVPGVETMLPLLLAQVQGGELDYEAVARLTSNAPARRFGFGRKGSLSPGSDADLVLFDPTDRRPILGDELHTDCGWTPFEGYEGVFPHLVLLRGEVVYRAPWADSNLPGSGKGEPFGPIRGKNVVEAD